MLKPASGRGAGRRSATGAAIRADRAFNETLRRDLTGKALVGEIGTIGVETAVENGHEI